MASETLKHPFRYIIFGLFLRPLIQRDYRLRQQGKKPDAWYWADRLAMSWGFYV